jgi:uncharacterized LabA/DUF88 family protein
MTLVAKKTIYAFIDAQNVNLAIRDQGWKLDWKRFRIYLKDKYCVEKAFLFIGFVSKNTNLYIKLQEAGFICIFKPTLEYKDGTTKGNCDAELALQTMIEYPHYDQAILISGDGDFFCLAKYLIDQSKLHTVLIPNMRRFSGLLKVDICRPYLKFMNDLRKKIGTHQTSTEKTPKGRNL